MCCCNAEKLELADEQLTFCEKICQLGMLHELQKFELRIKLSNSDLFSDPSISFVNSVLSIVTVRL